MTQSAKQLKASRKARAAVDVFKMPAGAKWSVRIGGMPISLHQRGRDNFTVCYWKQTDSNLTYGQACAKLGQAILHALSCEYAIDNRERGER